MKYQIMIDLETLGNNFIVQIGACSFDWDFNIYHRFLKNISIADNFNKGFSVGKGELLFWLQNTDKITWLKNTITVTKALQELTEFIKNINPETIWSHNYDFNILWRISNTLKQRHPINYKKWREIRTLVYLSGLKTNKKEKKKLKTHNALDDCVYQVKYCCEAYKKLKYEKEK